MGVDECAEHRPAGSRAGGLLRWLGGGHRRELGERHERSSHAVAGLIVLGGAVLAWCVASLAMAESTWWPLPAIVPSALVFAVLVGAATRGVASGKRLNRPGIAGRVAVAAAVGVVVGELAALVMFSGAIDRHLDEQALRNADSAPVVAQAAAALRQTQHARNSLDNAVELARANQDKALETARCEYHPSPGCPQTRITGVPGPGPETRTANELLADARRELDGALVMRDGMAPELNAEIARREQALADARRSAIAGAGRGLGPRWTAMNDLAPAGSGGLLLRLLTIEFCTLVYLLPLVLRLWRGETTHERRTIAHADRERAELEAETTIAIKRAEVRRATEIMWAEHQITQARLAIEAQREIDREQQRRRVVEALDAPVHAWSRRTVEPAEQEMYLPIAAETEAPSRAVAPLSAGGEPDDAPDDPEHLPAQVEASGEVQPRHEHDTPLISSLPLAAARWLRPLVPPIVARVIDTTARPLRTARQVFEEVEELTFVLRHTRKVTVDSESFDAAARPALSSTSHRQSPSWQPTEAAHAGRSSLDSAPHERKPQLTEREGSHGLEPPVGPRQLPPAH
ncbi:DUF4407 domain-containing protein [Mycobacterium sp. Lab-001]|uniref:DUF4407 domain-containing protein n=1 Tax=Mycobacterium sp. Lab-001 TaxID=3410136 RepID=UPI003D178D99